MMPRSRTVPSQDEGAPATEPAGALVASGPAILDGEVRGHIRQGPDYAADGLYRHGPQRAHPCLARLMGETHDAPPAPAPHVARIQQRARLSEKRRILARHERFLAAVRGEPVGRNRSVA